MLPEKGMRLNNNQSLIPINIPLRWDLVLWVPYLFHFVFTCFEAMNPDVGKHLNNGNMHRDERKNERQQNLQVFAFWCKTREDLYGLCG